MWKHCCFMLVGIIVIALVVVVTSLDALSINRSSAITHKKLPIAKMAARLAALRSVMASQPSALAAYVIPTADAHNSEYIAKADARRAWVSGFSGSAGTAVVTPRHALCWTDGRYYTQFARDTDPQLWTLMKLGLPDTPSIEEWLSANLQPGAVVGADPHTMSREEWAPLEKALSRANMRLVATPRNLVDETRDQLDDPPPPRPNNPIFPLPLNYTGKPAGDKIKELRDKMAEKRAAALVITALDEVAYTLNLRGSDIEYNPVFFSYLVLTNASARLFLPGAGAGAGAGGLPADVRAQLEREGASVAVEPYHNVTGWLANMAKELSEQGDGKHSIWLSAEASEAVHRAASGEEFLKQPLHLVSEVSPVALMKLVKNPVELEGFRECHVRDGIAVVRALRWLHGAVGAGEPVTELQASDKLLEFRREEEDFIGPSFETISAAGENAAVIHYSPDKSGSQRVITKHDMYLLDSGGQYRDGTTDITRTRHMGQVTPEQSDAFTRVLKGQIMIGAALFPKGVKGNALDSFARKALWDVGLDYGHGTGHGVGHFLNVHEGPSGVSWRPYPRDPGLAAGLVLSNEPGYYKVGAFGIRHEDLVEIIAVTGDTDHPRAAMLKGDFEGRGVLGLRTLTLAPHHAACIDVHLLDDFELSYLNAYHKRVLDTLGPVLRARGLVDDLRWLEGECAPLVRP